MDRTPVKIHILSGAPASGKSTYAIKETQRINGKDGVFAIHLSSDKIRKDLMGTKTILDMEESEWRMLNNKVFEKMFEMMIESVKSNNDLVDRKLTDVFYDATNLNLRRRKHLYKKIQHTLAGTGVEYTVNIDVFHAPLYVLQTRNSNRKGFSRVPRDKVKQMYFNQQPPLLNVDCDSHTYHGEHYFKNTNIYDLDNVEELVSSIEWSSLHRELVDIIGMAHDCEPYHYEKVNEHINMVYGLCKTVDALIPVSFIHDLGKAITKTFMENGKAHFRSHPNIGAMYSYVYGKKSNSDRVEDNELITKIILLHMVAHGSVSKKTRVRYKIVETDLELLMKFSSYDDLGRITYNTN